MSRDPAWQKIDALVSCGQLDEALSVAAEDLERTTAEHGRASEAHSRTLSRLAHVYSEKAAYEQSIPALREVAHFVAYKYGEASDEYSQVIRRLASDCLSSGLVEEAAILASKLIDNLERVGGDTNPDYAFAVTGLAYVYQKE